MIGPTARSLLAIALLGSCFASTASAQNPVHLKMGNPSQAVDDQSDLNNFLMRKDFYTLSYNNQKGTPNWVSWRLVVDDLGTAPRKPFMPDFTLPGGFTRITPRDYTGSGFDRGHMCPHSDRAKTVETSAATFIMTNMVPQSPENNQKAWDQMENYCRELVKSGKVCYIVDGPYGKGGIGRNGFRSTTPNGKVVVPAKTWKVVLVLDGDVDDPGTLDENSNIRLIGVIVPNDDTVGFDWAKYRVPVKEVEELTGYRFFDKVRSSVIDPLKEEHDEVPIPPPVHIVHDAN
jgi:endonuclease G, mitochondrial